VKEIATAVSMILTAASKSFKTMYIIINVNSSCFILRCKINVIYDTETYNSINNLLENLVLAVSATKK
jgi:hypothetical protein